MRLERQIRRRGADRLKGLGEHLQHLDIQHELLIGGREAAFEPTGRMQHEVAAAEKRAPQAHLRFIGGLGVRRIGSGRAR